MFRIGEFSRLGRVTIDTLRHYDALGLLKPAKVIHSQVIVTILQTSWSYSTELLP